MAFCSEDSGCAVAAKHFQFPNGLALGKDGLIYVPSSILGTVDVLKPTSKGQLERVKQIKTGFALDNISVDKKGHLFAAAFPRGVAIFEAYADPWNSHAPAAALRLSQTQNGSYTVEKVIEDGFGDILPAATTVVHDAETGRLFFSSEFNPVILIIYFTLTDDWHKASSRPG